MKLPIKRRYLIVGALVLGLVSFAQSYLNHTYIRASEAPFLWPMYAITPLAENFTWIVLIPLIYRFIYSEAAHFKWSLGVLVKYLLGISLFVGVHRVLSLCPLFGVAHVLNVEQFSMESFTRLLEFTPVVVLANVPAFLAIVALLLFADYYRKSHSRQVQLLEIQEQLAKANLEVLKNQIQPHFLFNALNSATALVKSDVGKAQVVLVKLASVLAQVLEVNERSLIKVSDELTFTEDYIELLEIRFGDRLQVEWSVEHGALDFYCPPFMIQTLVENTVKHKLSRSNGKVYLRIAIQLKKQQIYIEVSDRMDSSSQLQRETNTRQPGGRGLANIQQRLETIYGENYAFHTEVDNQGGFSVIYELPVDVLPVH
ncbi:MAG: histidine kinase [Bacteroidia bacterium]|nr:histidine kinase [Bacteroidia bacterium]